MKTRFGAGDRGDRGDRGRKVISCAGRLAFGAAMLAAAGCAGPLGALMSPAGRPATSATVRISYGSLEDRSVQTVPTATDFTISVYTDSGNNLGTLIANASGAISGSTLATIDLLPADTVLDFKVVLTNAGPQVAQGLKQATLVSQTAPNIVTITLSADGGDLSGGNTSGSVSQGSANNIVSARYRLLGGAYYQITPTAGGGGSCGSPTFLVDSGVDGAGGSALSGTGTSNTGPFVVKLASTGYYNVKSTVTGCGAGGTIGINAQKVASASVVVE